MKNFSNKYKLVEPIIGQSNLLFKDSKLAKDPVSIDMDDESNFKACQKKKKKKKKIPLITLNNEKERVRKFMTRNWLSKLTVPTEFSQQEQR